MFPLSSFAVWLLLPVLSIGWLYLVWRVASSGRRWGITQGIILLIFSPFVILLTFGALALLSSTLASLCVGLTVGMIGASKLIIELLGRRNFLASSHVQVPDMSASPRGLVEDSTYEQ